MEMSRYEGQNWARGKRKKACCCRLKLADAISKNGEKNSTKGQDLIEKKDVKGENARKSDQGL